MKMLFRFIKNIKSFWKFYKDYEYNGEDCEFIVDNYQEVLCSRTRTMSKPTYRASAVIAEIDEWYNESLKSVYGCEPIEKEKIKIISDGETAKLFIDGKKVPGKDVELHFSAHAGEEPMIVIDANWIKTDENNVPMLNEKRTEVLTEGININC